MYTATVDSELVVLGLWAREDLMTLKVLWKSP